VQGWAKKICELGCGANSKAASVRVKPEPDGERRAATAHEKPGKNQTKTEHKKHYRTLFRRDFGLGFPGASQTTELNAAFRLDKKESNRAELL
jgi:hypothetical protein